MSDNKELAYLLGVTFAGFMVVMLSIVVNKPTPITSDEYGNVALSCALSGDVDTYEVNKKDIVAYCYDGSINIIPRSDE